MSFVMLLSVLSGISFNAYAENGYPYSVKPGVYYADKWGFYQCECTSYCAFKLNEVNGIYFHNTASHGERWGNAGNWDDFARSKGITVNSTPAVGSIFYNDPYTGGAGSAGHVAWVSAVNGDYVSVEEYNWDTAKHAYNTRTVLKSKASGYIHIKDINPDPPEPTGHVMTEAEAAGQTIPDGDYWMVSELDQNYFVDLPGDSYSLSSGANVAMHLWGSNSVPLEYDAFTFKYLNNGFYKISQRTTNLCLDSQGATLKRSNAELYTANNSNAQQWSVVPTERGFKLQARCNSFFLDVKGAAVANETNVQVWETNESKAQYFGLIPYAPNERPIKDGIYTINASGNKSLFLDVPGFPQNYVLSSNVQVWDNDDEKFKIEYAGDGYYRIYESVSGYAVEVENTTDGFMNVRQNVKLYSKNNSKGQLWKIRKNTDGSYRFISKLSGYSLDLQGGAATATAGTNIHQWFYNNTDAQKWNINVPVAKPAKPVVNVSSKDKAVTVSWAKVPEINKYDKRTYSINIYQKTKSGIFNLVTNKTVEAKSGLTNTKYIFNAPDYGDYFVTVSAVNTNYDNYKTASDETAFTVTKLTPEAADIENAKTDKKLNVNSSKVTTISNLKKKTLTVNWAAVSGATNYQIRYRKAGAKAWKYAYTSGKNSYVIKNLKSRRNYEFSIRVFVNNDGKWVKSGWSNISRRYIYKAKIKSLSGAKKTLKISWSKDKKADYYQLQYSTDKGFKNAKRIDITKNKTTFKLKKLNKNKKYYVRVRSIVKSGKKKYIGEWSKRKAVKTK